MHTDGSCFDEERGPLGRLVLDFEQEAVKQLGIEAPLERKARTDRLDPVELETGRHLAVLLQRFAGQEVLQEVHSRPAHEGRQSPLAAVGIEPAQAADQASRAGAPKGLRIVVVLAPVRVAVSSETGNEAGGVLVQMGQAENRRALGIAQPIAMVCGQEAVFVAFVFAEAAGAGVARIDPQRHIVAAAGQTRAELTVVITAVFRRHRIDRIDPRVAGADIDHAVQPARCVAEATRAAQHTNRRCVGQVDLEQVVDVAEARRPDRHPGFEIQQSAAATGAGQQRRTDRGQVLLAAAASDPGPGNSREQLRGVGGRDGCQIVAVELGHGRRCRRIEIAARHFDPLQFGSIGRGTHRQR